MVVVAVGQVGVVLVVAGQVGLVLVGWQGEILVGEAVGWVGAEGAAQDLEGVRGLDDQRDQTMGCMMVKRVYGEVRVAGNRVCWQVVVRGGKGDLKGC